MKRRTIFKLLAVLICLWMLLAITVATPASAHDDNGNGNGNGNGHSKHDDDDDENDVTTTTMAPPPTPTTTTPPPPVVTTTSTPPSTTTTTTTPPPPSDPRWLEWRLETFEPNFTNHSNPMGYRAKESLVLSIANSHLWNGDGGGGGSGAGSHISPREGLTVIFRTAVETIESQLLLASLLGALIATLTWIGFDKRG